MSFLIGPWQQFQDLRWDIICRTAKVVVQNGHGEALESAGIWGLRPRKTNAPTDYHYLDIFCLILSQFTLWNQKSTTRSPPSYNNLLDIYSMISRKNGNISRWRDSSAVLNPLQTSPEKLQLAETIDTYMCRSMTT